MITFNPVVFTAKKNISNNKFNDEKMIIKKLKKEFLNSKERPDCIKDLYKSSAEYLDKKIDKNDYLAQLYSNFNKIYFSNKPVSKIPLVKMKQNESTFFENFFPRLDELDSLESVSKEEIVRNLKLLV